MDAYWVMKSCVPRGRLGKSMGSGSFQGARKRLENYLSDLLQIKVDLVTKEALKPYIGKLILQDVVYV